MARPTKFTPDTRQRILQAIELGATYELAANYGGISYELLRQWIIKGELVAARLDKARKDTELSEDDAAFLAFIEALKSAEGKAAVTWLAKIEKAASDGNWQAAAWKLERRYPRQYGRTVHEHEVRDVSKLTDDELERLARGEGGG